MASGVTLDMTDDFGMTPELITKAESINVPSASNGALIRTLILSPPSISAHPARLSSIFEAHDRNATDIQMLDRLALNLVSLPPSTYDTVLLLTDADNTRVESQRLLDRAMLSRLVAALKPGGHIKAQDGSFGISEEEKREIILAGLVLESGAATKPATGASAGVPLRFGKGKAAGGAKSTTVAAGTGVEVNANGKRTSQDLAGGSSALAGVGFDMGDDLDDDDELIDEDDLIDEEDLQGRIVQREFPKKVELEEAYLCIADRCSRSLTGL